MPGKNGQIGFSGMVRAATNARKPCRRRLMASVYPSRMLAFTLIPGHLGNVGSATSPSAAG